VSGVGGWLADQREADAAAAVRAVRAHPPRCFGAESVTAACAGVAVRDGVVPAPVGALADRPKVCMQDIGVAKLRVCDYGPDPADAKLDIAVVGDSHAAHWMSAFQVIAKQQKWHVSTLLKGSCPLIDARRTSSGAEADSCETWKRRGARVARGAPRGPVRRGVGELGQPVPDVVRRRLVPDRGGRLRLGLEPAAGVGPRRDRHP
jgi:hypothetical protein